MREMIRKASLDGLEEVQQFIESYLEQDNCPPKECIRILIAVEEIYVNIAHYAYPDENADGKGMVRIVLDDSTSGNIKITFYDDGKPFNPLAKEDPDINLSSEKRKIGGLGIYMVKNNMDQVTYSYKDKQNILSIEKQYKV